MRSIPVGRTVGLSLLTLGIYGAVWGYRNAQDLHQERDSHKRWQLLFWLGFPTLGLAWGVLAILNFVRLNRLRAAIGVPPRKRGVWAMILIWVPLLSGLAALLWAQYWNESVEILTG